MALSYFDYFENVVVNEIQIKNIFDNISMKQIYHDDLAKKKEIFDNVPFNEDDSLETLAYKLYEDKQLWWVITVSNQTKDYLYDFPLKSVELRAYHRKYVDNLNDENEGQTGYPLTLDDEQTIWLAMVDENETKRIIKALKRRYLGDFLSAVKQLKGV